MIMILLIVLLGSCCAIDITIPYSDTLGPARKPWSYLWYFSVPAAALNWSQTNVTVLLQSLSGPDWDLAATEGVTPPTEQCASGWQNHSAGSTEFLTFPVIAGHSYIVRACAYSDSFTSIRVTMNYLTSNVVCTRITGFLDDQLEYQRLSQSPSPYPIFVGKNLFEGSTAGAVIGHQTDSTRLLVVITPDNSFYNLIYDVGLKIGFSVTPDAVTDVDTENCGASPQKRVTQLVRRPLKSHRDGLLDPVVCTFTVGTTKVSYQWTSNQTNGDLQARFYTTRVVTPSVTSEGFGYIFKGGLTTFVWGQAGIPYAMIVENLGRIGRTPKVRVAYHIKSPILPLADAQIDLVDANITTWKCV